MAMEIRVEVADRLQEHVVFETEMSGMYTDAGDYVRDLIRRDMDRADREFAAVKAELQEAFAAPEDSYVRVTADEVLARNNLSRLA